jgi:hypothetical protein
MRTNFNIDPSVAKMNLEQVYFLAVLGLSAANSYGTTNGPAHMKSLIKAAKQIRRESNPCHKTTK